jgi:hypothetical protein
MRRRSIVPIAPQRHRALAGQRVSVFRPPPGYGPRAVARCLPAALALALALRSNVRYVITYRLLYVVASCKAN